MKDLLHIGKRQNSRSEICSAQSLDIYAAMALSGIAHSHGKHLLYMVHTCIVHAFNLRLLLVLVQQAACSTHAACLFIIY